ncbi:MAG: thermonuclease family protein [Alphaproteobacteria bacterium]
MQHRVLSGIFTVFLVSIWCFSLSATVYAQEDITGNVRVSDHTNLLMGQDKITLWGITPIDFSEAAFLNLQARSALEEKIGRAKVSCTIKKRVADALYAQCINVAERDLSLFLLQQGFVTADRDAIYQTVYEAPYLNAEKLAQDNQIGVWDASHQNTASSEEGRDLIISASLLAAFFLLVLVAFSFYIMRGFGRVIDAQNQTVDLASKERALRDKEKYIIASMLDAEIQSNKAKIEAYLTIYEEMLSEFSDSDKVSQYQKTGEVVQKQPALGRSVFDGNTNKLELLGANLASELIHYYARIKTAPDYTEITPEMSKEDAQKTVGEAIEQAQKLDVISTRLLSRFVDYALVKRDQ